jgi:hypothetical protein
MSGYFLKEPLPALSMFLINQDLIWRESDIVLPVNYSYSFTFVRHTICHIEPTRPVDAKDYEQ